MTGFSKIRNVKQLKSYFPHLSMDSPIEGIYNNSGTLEPELLEEGSWKSIWKFVKPDIIKVLGKFLLGKEKSYYPFFFAFFQTFLVLSGYRTVINYLEDHGPSAESPGNSPRHPGRGAPQEVQARAGPASGPAAEPGSAGTGSEGSRGGPSPLPSAGGSGSGVTANSLKCMHEQEIKGASVAGPVEFVMSDMVPCLANRQLAPLGRFLVEAKNELNDKTIEAAMCQVAAQATAVLGTNIADFNVYDPVRAVLTDAFKWILVECKFTGEKADVGSKVPVKVSISFSRIYEVFLPPTMPNKLMSIGTEEDVAAVVSWLTCSMVKGKLKDLNAETIVGQMSKFNDLVAENSEKWGFSTPDATLDLYSINPSLKRKLGE